MIRYNYITEGQYRGLLQTVYEESLGKQVYGTIYTPFTPYYNYTVAPIGEMYTEEQIEWFKPFLNSHIPKKNDTPRRIPCIRPEFIYLNDPYKSVGKHIWYPFCSVYECYSYKEKWNLVLLPNDPLYWEVGDEAMWLQRKCEWL